MREFRQSKSDLIFLTVPDTPSRHPVHNDYLPPAFRGEVFLKEPDQIWDEDALVRWETECNGGQPWSGRPAPDSLPESRSIVNQRT